jgi:hypothetical protein
MATKKSNPAMDFLVAELKKNKKSSYADIKAKADEKKLSLYPIMFGRAQAMLGIVKSAKRGTGKFAKAKKAAKARAAAGGRRGRPSGGGSSKSDKIRELLRTGMDTAAIAKKVGCSTNLVYVVKSAMGGAKGKRGRPAKRGPGRPRKTAGSTSLNGIDGILAAVQNSQRERTQLRAALEKIQGVIEGALTA